MTRERTKLASSSSRLAWSKGPTREQRKRSKRAIRNAIIAGVRGYVFLRSACCQVCGDEAVRVLHQMHEIIPRSLLRGRPPQEIFNPWNCCRICPTCHEDVQQHRIDLVFEDEDRGADGPILAQRRLPGLPPSSRYTEAPEWAHTAALSWAA